MQANAVSPRQLTVAILRLRDRFVDLGISQSYWEINNGHCREFALDVLAAVGGESASTYFIWNGDLMVGADPERPERGTWDAQLVHRKWGLGPPLGLTWDEINSVTFGNHIWIVHQGRHFDAECPYGVDNFFSLPLFRRHIQQQLLET